MIYGHSRGKILWRKVPLAWMLLSGAFVFAIIGMVAYWQEDLVIMLLAGIPILAISFVLIVWFFELAYLSFLVMAPFYYSPTLFIGANSLGEEGFWFRAGKDVLILTLFAAWVFRTLLRGRTGINLNFLTITVITYILFGSLRGLTNNASDLVDTLRIFVEYTLFYFMSQDIFRRYRLVEQQVLLWVYAGALVSIIGIVEYFMGGVDLAHSRAAGQIRIVSTLFNPNALGWYLSFTSALVIGLLSARPVFHRVHLSVLVGILLVNVTALFFTGSRSSLVVLMLILVLSLLVSKKFKFVIVSAVVIFILATTLIWIQRYIVSEQLRILSQEGIWARTEIYERAIVNFLYLPSIDILAGAASKNLAVAKSYGLVFDSQYFVLLFYGGLIGVSLLLMIQAMVGTRLVSWALKYHGSFVSLLLAYSAIVLTSVIGNSLAIFPHAVFFWVLAGIATNSKLHFPLKR